LRTVLVGYAFAVTTPAEVGEVAARVRMHEGVAGPRVVGLVMVEKLLHSMLALVPGLPALVLFATYDPRLAWLSGAVLCAVVVTVLAFRGRLARLRFDARWPRWTRVAQTLREVGHVKVSTLWKLTISTSLILATYVLQEYFLINAVTTLGIVDTWNGFWAGIGLRTLAPFFIGDLGIREASHVVFFGRYGVAPQAAMATSLLMFAVNILLPTLLGLVLLFTKERARS
ncbi:MAG: lysylphosphatidylglycerol synthase domain-containing protein, partial [Bacteroidota bacterium]